MRAISVLCSALRTGAGPQLSVWARWLLGLTLIACVTCAVFHPIDSSGAGLSYVDYFREKVKTAPKEYQPFYQGEQLDLIANLFVAPPTWKRQERSAQGLAWRGWAAMHDGNRNRALWFFDKALEDDPQCAAAYTGRAIVNADLHNLEASLRDCNAAINQQPRISLLYYTRGAADFQNTNYSEALKDFTKSIELTPNADMAYLGRAGVFCALSNCPAAQEDIKHGLEINSSSAFDFDIAGQVELLCKNEDEAMQYLTHAIELKSKSPVTYVQHGLILAKQDKVAEALRDFDEAVRLRPAFPEALRYRGDVKVYLQDYEGALKDVRQLCQLEPKTPNNYRWAASLCRELREYRQELLALEKALQLDPTNRAIFISRTRVKATLQDYKGALADIDKGFETFGENATFHSQRAVIFHHIDKLERAVNECTRAIELSTNAAGNIGNRGWIKYDQGDYAGAQRDFKQALQPDDPPGTRKYHALGLFCASVRLGQSEEAKQDLAAYIQGRVAGKTNEWFLTVANFLLGKLSETDLLKAASGHREFETREHLCEACFYIGIKKMAEHDTKAAAKYFKKCQGTQVYGFREFVSASYEQKRLSK
jgi:tetratricopeptide (TPR) repeat protein